MKRGAIAVLTASLLAVAYIHAQPAKIEYATLGKIRDEGLHRSHSRAPEDWPSPWSSRSPSALVQTRQSSASFVECCFVRLSIGTRTG
jgi:hypothetical protein